MNKKRKGITQLVEKLNVPSDQSSFSFRVGHWHVQLTGVVMYNFTTDGKKISKVQNGLL